MGTFGRYTGIMNIPDEKKEQFTEWIEKVLNYGGMMELEEVNMFGQKTVLLKPIEIHDDRKINFHYNYFEDDAWENASYNASNAHFYSGKIGGLEFCDIITAVHFLYEVNDENYGFAKINGEIVSYKGYVGWLNHILGTNFSMEKRFRLWDNIEQFSLKRLEDGYDAPVCEFGDIMNFIPGGLQYVAGGIDFTDLCYITKGTDSLQEDKVKQGSYPEAVYKCKKELLSFFEKNKDETATDKIWNLIKMNKSNREHIKNKDLFKLAQMTLVLPARVIVYLTAELKYLDFWEQWKLLKDFVYHDEKMQQYASQQLADERRRVIEKPIDPISTCDILYQNDPFLYWSTPKELHGKPKYYISDDDRLYWWDGTDEVIISEKMDAWLKKLAREHKEFLDVCNDEDVEQNTFLENFMKLLEKINAQYKRIFPFQNMFYDFIQNGNKKEYIAAVKLFEKLANDNLAEGKVIEHISGSWNITSRKVTHNIGRLRLKRFLSVMANKQLRKKYFDF